MELSLILVKVGYDENVQRPTSALYVTYVHVNTCSSNKFKYTLYR